MAIRIKLWADYGSYPLWGVDEIDNIAPEELRLFGLCYAMNGGYRGCNPCIERHLAIFVNYFCLERTNQLSSQNYH
ncbi:MAG: hypothetical protein EWV41_14625 [Microcystis wesenbergii Mw_MB_S_20031200_S109]|nr:MAG: hypothetical protein EWV41_14625 [Microcystis wesenbergii Mw_MB_S_20031200_S109]